MMKRSKMQMEVKSELGKMYKQGEMSGSADGAVKNSLLTQGGSFPADAMQGGVNTAYPKSGKYALDKSLLKKYSQGEL
jgi:hypothetical protein